MKKMNARKIPVFVFPIDSSRIGNGVHKMIACFVKTGMHVAFSVYCHSENIYPNSVDGAIACDGSCGHGRSGTLHDLSDNRDCFFYPKLVEAAERAAHKTPAMARPKRKK